jgi:hypothetical protein
MKHKKVRVNAILPGFIDTPMLHYGITEEHAKELNPLQPEDLIPYYVYFASDLSTGITGSLVNIEHFRYAMPIIKELKENNDIKEWEELEPVLKEKIPREIFTSIKKNKKLLMNII